MPRTARASVGGVIYHVINRGNGRAKVFHKADDFDAFEGIIADGVERLPIRVLGYCLMPNHFHMVLHPHGDGELSRFMQWLLTTHVRRYHRQYRGSGHVWQGRFKAFPVQKAQPLLTVLRYVEGNPVRAGLVPRAQDWRWSSLHRLSAKVATPWLSKLPVARPAGWTSRVNRPQSDEELEVLRRSVNRSSPFGDPSWVKRTATALVLESTLNPRGRPRKTQSD